MSTGNRKVDIYLKKFLTQQQITENFFDFLEGKRSSAIKHLRAALSESIKNVFALERCYAAVILSYINENNPPTPCFKGGYRGVRWEQSGLSAVSYSTAVQGHIRMPE